MIGQSGHVVDPASQGCFQLGHHSEAVVGRQRQGPRQRRKRASGTWQWVLVLRQSAMDKKM